MKGRVYRVHRDLVQLPLKYMDKSGKSGRLPNGELYGYVRYKELPPWIKEKGVPVFPPGFVPTNKEDWYVFGRLESTREDAGPDAGPGISPDAGPGIGPEDAGPVEPTDPLAGFWAIAGDPRLLAGRCVKNAYGLEIVSCLLWAIGIVLNFGFLAVIIQRFF